MTHLILIVEDEPEIADILAAYLKRSGMRTAVARDGRQALEMHQALQPALMLLDVQLPGLNGWQVLAAVRATQSTPIIMLTAMDQDVDKLTGLRVGADDYVVKPFNPAEVVARVEAVLRRSLGIPSRLEAPSILVAGPFEMDFARHMVCVTVSQRKVSLELTPTEFNLLAEMMKSPGRVFSRERLLSSCLPDGDPLERTVDSHISKLRRKLEDLGIYGVPATVRGVGYKLGIDE